MSRPFIVVANNKSIIKVSDTRKYSDFVSRNWLYQFDMKMEPEDYINMFRDEFDIYDIKDNYPDIKIPNYEIKDYTIHKNSGHDEYSLQDFMLDYYEMLGYQGIVNHPQFADFDWDIFILKNDNIPERFQKDFYKYFSSKFLT